MSQAEIGIIGGSGLYALDGIHEAQEVDITTPWGVPSDNYLVGTLSGRRVAFLARHGRGHRISPSELNYRANIFGMKKLGVERIISLSAVGSQISGRSSAGAPAPSVWSNTVRPLVCPRSIWLAPCGATAAALSSGPSWSLLR